MLFVCTFYFETLYLKHYIHCAWILFFVSLQDATKGCARLHPQLGVPSIVVQVQAVPDPEHNVQPCPRSNRLQLGSEHVKSQNSSRIALQVYIFIHFSLTLINFNLVQGDRGRIFFPVLLSSFITPLWWEPYCHYSLFFILVHLFIHRIYSALG